MIPVHLGPKEAGQRVTPPETMEVGEGEVDQQRETLGLHQHGAQLTARVGIGEIQAAERSELNHRGRFGITVASR